MKVGVIFPQCEIGADTAVLRDYARTAEAVGYSHLLAYEHVLGVNRNTHPDFEGPYDHEDLFHEPFTLFSYLAAVTDDIRFVPGVLVLPQRQTALVAKQAAEVDVLSNGRITIGAGVGWNSFEYEALGTEFSTRGKRIEEQIEVLRELWTNNSVDFRGEWHTLPDVGINPLPNQRPIPIWMGGGADIVLQRAARIADGWIVPAQWKTPDSDFEHLERTRDTLYGYLEREDRDPADFELIGRMALRSDDPDEWITRTRRWEDAGVNHLMVSTMGMGLETPEQHIETIQRWKAAVDESSIMTE